MITSAKRKTIAAGVRSPNPPADMALTLPKLGFLILFFSCWSAALTSTEADAALGDRVVDLPGQPNVSFAHYAGFITVNESHGRALFYWFFEAKSDPSSKPLLLWLNGGPGCSSVGYGEAEELGPFRVNKDGASVSVNDYAWNNEVNLLFLESPAGVGYSYSNTTSDYDESGDNRTALDAHAFLVGWFEKYPMYKSHDFYIAGESYAGHYVPQLAKLILDMNKEGTSPLLLKGILIGNALLHLGLDSKGLVDFAWSHAIISDAFYRNISGACNYTTEDWSDECGDLMESLFDQYKPINIYNIYVDVCLERFSSNVTGGPVNEKFFSSRTVAGPPKRKQRKALNFQNPNRRAGARYDPCIDNHVLDYFNLKDVQRALHADTNSTPSIWTLCSKQIGELWNDSPYSVLPTLEAVIAAGLRVWVFSGDTDGRLPVLSSRYSIEALELETKTDWYPWYYQNQVGGWSEVYQGLTYATVRGAGHMVPTNQPGRALALLTNFIAGTPLPSKS